MRILYVCPLAYYSGHPPWAAKYEPLALKNIGHDVTLLTYCGLNKGMSAEVPQITVSRDTWAKRALRKYTGVRLFFMTYEVVSCINKALKLRGDYDCLYLRDGEPGIFIVHLLSKKFSGVKWGVSMMGSVVCAPKEKRDSIKRWHLNYYTKGIEYFNGTIWRGLYRKSLEKNKFALVTQNQLIADTYESWQGGVFKGKVFTQPMGTVANAVIVDKTDVRARLGLPKDKFILLCFGVPHPGKDIEVIYQAARALPDTYILYAGVSKFSIGDEPKKLAVKYGLQDRCRILDYYVPEFQKPGIFGASDACVLSYTREFKATTSGLWDACKFRIPVIASEANTLGELVRQYKIGVTFVNSDFISLIRAIKEAQKIKNVDEQADKFVSDFSLEAWAKGVTGILEKHLLGQS